MATKKKKVVKTKQKNKQTVKQSVTIHIGKKGSSKGGKTRQASSQSMVRPSSSQVLAPSFNIHMPAAQPTAIPPAPPLAPAAQLPLVAQPAAIPPLVAPPMGIPPLAIPPPMGIPIGAPLVSHIPRPTVSADSDFITAPSTHTRTTPYPITHHEPYFPKPHPPLYPKHFLETLPTLNDPYARVHSNPDITHLHPFIPPNFKTSPAAIPPSVAQPAAMSSQSNPREFNTFNSSINEEYAFGNSVAVPSISNNEEFPFQGISNMYSSRPALRPPTMAPMTRQPSYELDGLTPVSGAYQGFIQPQIVQSTASLNTVVDKSAFAHPLDIPSDTASGAYQGFPNNEHMNSFDTSEVISLPDDLVSRIKQVKPLEYPATIAPLAALVTAAPLVKPLETPNSLGIQDLYASQPQTEAPVNMVVVKKPPRDRVTGDVTHLDRLKTFVREGYDEETAQRAGNAFKNPQEHHKDNKKATNKGLIANAFQIATSQEIEPEFLERDFAKLPDYNTPERDLSSQRQKLINERDIRIQQMRDNHRAWKDASAENKKVTREAWDLSKKQAQDLSADIDRLRREMAEEKRKKDAARHAKP